MVERIMVPDSARVIDIVVGLLTVECAWPIGDNEAESTSVDRQSIVYEIDAGSMPGSGGVDHDRTQSVGVQVTTNGTTRKQADLCGAHIVAVLTDMEIRPRRWKHALTDGEIIVFDRDHRKVGTTREPGSPVWTRVDRFRFYTSLV